MSVSGILLQAAAQFPTAEASASALSQQRNAHTEQVPFSLDFKSMEARSDSRCCREYNAITAHTQTNKPLLFPGVTTSIECLNMGRALLL